MKHFRLWIGPYLKTHVKIKFSTSEFDIDFYFVCVAVKAIAECYGK